MRASAIQEEIKLSGQLLGGASHFASKSGSSDSLFVTNASGSKGNSPILIGLLEYFQRHIPHVGFFQPIGADPLTHTIPPVPKHVAVLREHCHLQDEPHEMYGVSEEEATDLLASGRVKELFEKVESRYREYKRDKDLVIIEGATVPGIGNLLELNGRFAAELDAPVFMIMDVHPDERPSVNELYNRAMIHKQDLQSEHADVLGVVLNKVPRREHALITSQLSRRLTGAGLAFAGGLPEDPIIATARFNEICTALGATLLYGQPEDLDTDVSEVLVISEDIAAFLDKIDRRNAARQQEGLPPMRPLVVTSKSRVDAILSLTAAHVCGTGPHVAGILLTDADTVIGTVADRILMRYADQLVPIAEVRCGTYAATHKVGNVHPGILPNSAGKIEHCKELFSRFIDANTIASQMVLPKTGKLTPKRFINNIHNICRSELQNIVLPESYDKRVLAAAAEVVSKRLARITLLGKEEEVRASAERFGIDISGCEILDITSGPTLERYAGMLVEARRKKGLTLEQARDQMTDINMFATMMVRAGDADGMVSGATCTTANTIRPALQILKTDPPTLVSSIFFMCLPDKVLTYGDCAVVVDPNAEELAQVARCSADTATAFGLEARVAMLSYSTLGSGAGPQVEKVTKATEIVKKLRPDLKIEGPLQYDASVDPTVAAQKIKAGSEVAGKATVCVFPDLNTGNNTYKAVQQSTGAIAIGPLMQGLSRPVNDLSRGCTVADIVNTVACTAVQAIGIKRTMAKDPVARAA